MITIEQYNQYIDFYCKFDNTWSTDVEKIQQVLINCWLLLIVDDNITSKRVLKNKEKRKEISEKRSMAWKISAEKKAEQREISTSVEQVSTSVEQNSTKERKGKEKKEKEKEKKENNNSLTVVNETQSVAEYWNSEINDLQNIIIDTCKENWLLYSWKWQTERNSIKRLLSKKMQDRLTEIWMTIEWMIKSVIPISSRMQYQKALTSWKMIYYERENVYNKAKSEFWQKRHVDLTLYNQTTPHGNQTESAESENSVDQME